MLILYKRFCYTGLQPLYSDEIEVFAEMKAQSSDILELADQSRALVGQEGVEIKEERLEIIILF